MASRWASLVRLAGTKEKADEELENSGGTSTGSGTGCATVKVAGNEQERGDGEADARPSKLVLGQWNEIAGKLITMAEDFPEDKYDFKPTLAQRTFAEQLLHAAGTTYYFTNLANGQKPPAEEDPKRTDFRSKAEIVAFVKKMLRGRRSSHTVEGRQRHGRLD